MLQLLWGLVNALAEELIFNRDLLVLYPAAFNLQDHGHSLQGGIALLINYQVVFDLNNAERDLR